MEAQTGLLKAQPELLTPHSPASILPNHTARPFRVKPHNQVMSDGTTSSEESSTEVWRQNIKTSKENIILVFCALFEPDCKCRLCIGQIQLLFSQTVKLDFEDIKSQPPSSMSSSVQCRALHLVSRPPSTDRQKSSLQFALRVSWGRSSLHSPTLDLIGDIHFVTDQYQPVTSDVNASGAPTDPAPHRDLGLLLL